MDWDIFISHASEDKPFVRELADALRKEKYKVWFDEINLTVGDSLRRSIDRGLTNSKYGVVVLSTHFFAKEWPRKELDGLVARENAGEKVILPVWLNIKAEQIRKFSPILADRVGVSSDRGITYVVAELIRAMRSTIVEVSEGKNSNDPGETDIKSPRGQEQLHVHLPPVNKFSYRNIIDFIRNKDYIL